MPHAKLDDIFSPTLDFKKYAFFGGWASSHCKTLQVIHYNIISAFSCQCSWVLLLYYLLCIHFTHHLALGNCLVQAWSEMTTEETKCCRNCGWAGVLLLLSFMYRTWQYDNILSAILSDTRLWSSPIINPGWAPAQVVQQKKPYDCQHVWQRPSIPQTWRWSYTGDTLTLSTAYTVDSTGLQPTNPSVEVIIRSPLKTQVGPSTMKCNSTYISDIFEIHGFSIGVLLVDFFFPREFLIYILYRNSRSFPLCWSKGGKGGKIWKNQKNRP